MSNCVEAEEACGRRRQKIVSSYCQGVLGSKRCQVLLVEMFPVLLDCSTRNIL